MILLAHMDVVGVERARWTYDPFEGELADGYLYGRGAIDDKGMLAANLMVMLLLKRMIANSGKPLARDPERCLVRADGSRGPRCGRSEAHR